MRISFLFTLHKFRKFLFLLKHYITLNWSTVTEINNSGFNIERSIIPNSNAMGDLFWESIGFVKGKGTSTETHSYSFIDNDLDVGKYQYRLKQIDMDGSIKYYYLTETIEIMSPDKFELHQNYPNPFNPTTKIKYSIPSVILSSSKDDESGVTLRLRQLTDQSDIKVTLKVYDVLGNEIVTLVDEQKEAGYYEVEFSTESFGNATQLTSGVYFYRLQAGNFIQTKKMVLLR
jgi:hypothetical protein